MRNQIVSQDELREEGGSPTHALFALEMLLCRGGWGDCYVHHESTLRLFFVCFVTWQQEIRLLTERNEAGDMVSYWCWETWENGYWRDIQLISKWSIYKVTFSMPLFCCLWTEQNWLARRFVNRQELHSRTADGSELEPMWQRIPQFLQQVPLRISICPSFCSLSVFIFVSVWIELPSRISRRRARLPRWWSRKCLSISLTSKRPTRLPHGFPTVSRQKTWRNR